MEAVLNNNEFQTEENYEKIDHLIKETEIKAKSIRLTINLFRYFDLKGEYDKAENLLFDLIEISPAFAAAEGEKFFSRLKLKSDEELLKGNFSREEIEQGRVELEKRKRI